MSTDSQRVEEAKSKTELSDKFRVITVEPLIAAYTLASRLRLVCVEPGLTSRHEEADSIFQKLSFLKPLNLVILVVLLGSYSDKHRLRKPFLLIPILSEFSGMVSYVVCLAFLHRVPARVVNVVNMVQFGGDDVMLLAALALIADVTTAQTRTFRLGVIYLVMFACLEIVFVADANLHSLMDFWMSASIAVGLHVFAVVHWIFWVREPRPCATKSKKTLILDVFSPRHFLNTFNLLLQKNKLVLVVLGLILVRNTVFYGFYLDLSWLRNFAIRNNFFVQRTMLVWSLGTLFWLPLLAKIFKITDSIILTLAFLNTIVVNIILELARSTTMVFVACNIDVVSPLAIIALQSMLTKLVSSDDFAKALALFAVTKVVFYELYANGILPAPALYLGAVFYGCCLPVILWLYFKNKKNKIQEPENRNSETASQTTQV